MYSYVKFPWVGGSNADGESPLLLVVVVVAAGAVVVVVHSFLVSCLVLQWEFL